LPPLYFEHHKELYIPISQLKFHQDAKNPTKGVYSPHSQPQTSKTVLQYPLDCKVFGRNVEALHDIPWTNACFHEFM
jgi:hypothetical protein